MFNELSKVQTNRMNNLDNYLMDAQGIDHNDAVYNRTRHDTIFALDALSLAVGGCYLAKGAFSVARNGLQCPKAGLALSKVSESTIKSIKTQTAKKINPLNYNPFKSNVSQDVVIADIKGNILPVRSGQFLTGNSEGKWLQIRDGLSKQ